MAEIQDKVVAIIVDKLGVDASEVTLESNFTNDLGADSLDTVELIMEFEKEFGLSIPDEKAENIVLAGGPVSQDRGFILHTTQPGWSASLALTSEIMVTTSKDILSSLGNSEAPEKSIVTLGYAGWSAGQLEEEIRANSWLMVEADTELLFDTPIHKKWEAIFWVTKAYIRIFLA